MIKSSYEPYLSWQEQCKTYVRAEVQTSDTPLASISRKKNTTINKNGYVRVCIDYRI